MAEILQLDKYSNRIGIFLRCSRESERQLGLTNFLKLICKTLFTLCANLALCTACVFFKNGDLDILFTFCQSFYCFQIDLGIASGLRALGQPDQSERSSEMRWTHAGSRIYLERGVLFTFSKTIFNLIILFCGATVKSSI